MSLVLYIIPSDQFLNDANKKLFKCKKSGEPTLE